MNIHSDIHRLVLLTALAAASVVSTADTARAAPPPTPGLTLAPDPSGVLGTFDVSGATDRSNPFFQSLGSNGRSCSTCHIAAEAMSFTPGHARQAYADTLGADPLFASVDGANCPEISAGNRAGHSLILRSGLIRIGLAVPANAEYSIALVRDPTGCGLRADSATNVLTASVYRRPLPAANLAFLSAVMFDGRETVAPLGSPATFLASLRTDLAHQATDATLGHAQAHSAPAEALVQAIVDFELGLFTAQYADAAAGRLDRGGAAGGAVTLAAQPYYPGINDALGADPSGLPFTADAMSLYRAWEGSGAGAGADAGEEQALARADIAAGERLFNERALTITHVRGLNDNAALGSPASLTGQCTTCHDTPGIGNHSLPLPLDIGTSHSADPSLEPDPLIRAAVAELSVPGLPVFLVSGCPDPFNAAEPASFYTSDLGKALVSGKCSDFNRLKGPVLRGLAGRAPYFHNGAAATLLEVVGFYDQRFQMRLTAQEKRQLVAFLNSL